MPKRRQGRGGSTGAIWFVVLFLALLVAGFVQAIGSSAGRKSSSGPRPEVSEATYSIPFGPEFKPALASRDDLGISVVLALDMSGSMADAPASGGSPKYVQAANAYLQVVDVLERLVAESPGGQVIKVGVLKFNDVATPVLPLVELDGLGLESLRGLAYDRTTFVPGGSTAIGSAIEKGVEWLSQSGTILRSVIVVTDGENKTGPEPAWTLSALRGDRNSASTPDFPVSTSSTLVSFIGFDVDAGQFRPLERYGVRVASAADQAGLATALSSLLEADVTRLEASATGDSR